MASSVSWYGSKAKFHAFETVLRKHDEKPLTSKEKVI